LPPTLHPTLPSAPGQCAHTLPTDVLSRLRAEVEKADAAVARAEADAAAATRRAERVKAQLDRLAAKRRVQSKGWHLSEEGYQILLRERAETDAHAPICS
jgi:hypothetical protein